jgi:CheY-like chemotaxis protein
MAYRIAYYQPLLPEKSAITSAVNALSSAYKTGKNVEAAESKLNKIIDNLNKLNSEFYDGEEAAWRVPSVYMFEQERGLVSGRVDTLKAAVKNSKNQQLIDNYTDRSNIEIDKSYKLPSNEKDLRTLLSQGWSYPGGTPQQESGGGEAGGGGAPSAPSAPYFPSNIPIDDGLWQQAANYYAAQQGVTLPSYFKEMIRYASETEPSSNKQKEYQQDISARVSDFKSSANGLHDRALYGLGYKYQNNTIYRTDPLRDRILSTNEDILKQIANGASQSGLPVEQIQSAVGSGAAKSIDDYNARSVPDSTFFDTAFGIGQNVLLAYATSGLSTGQQIAFNAANAYLQGAKPEDIVRGAIGSLVANQFRPLGTNAAGVPETTGVSIIDDFNKTIQAINSPELQSAIFNGVRQGVYATATEQDIAKNVAAGAVAGAVATNVQNKYNSPALAYSVGEFVQAKIAGKTDLEAMSAAISGYATEEEKANAKKVITDEISALPLDQVQALGYKTQDEITGSFYPKEKELPPVVVTAQRDPQDIDGLSLIRRVRTGAEVDEGRRLPEVVVTAKREDEELPEVVVTAKREDISEPQRLITESAEDTVQEEPEVQRSVNRPVLLGLLGGGISGATQNQRTQRTPSEREAASMQALSQALSVGDPGDALFGSGLGRRRNVWNEESLRLKDELGG